MSHKATTILAMLALGFAAFSTGCTTNKKGLPHGEYQGMVFQGSLPPDSFIVYDKVEGTAMSTKCLLGIFETIHPMHEGERKRMKFLGIPLYNPENEVIVKDPALVKSGLIDDGVSNAAYYNAMMKHPDADVLLTKAVETKSHGIPLLWEDKTVTWVGRAIKLRPGLANGAAPADGNGDNQDAPEGAR